VKYIDWFFNALLDLCISIAKAMLVAMVLIICIHVLFRYAFNTGIKWSEEISMMLMVYFGFISITYGVKHNLHLNIVVFFEMFPKIIQKILAKLIHIIIFSIGIVLMLFGFNLIQSTINNVMTATRLPSAMLYGAVPVSGLLIAYFSFANLIGYQSGYKNIRGGAGND
jgi:TRAP-type C4-dicarboxylate transport system permease small subunit